MFPTGKNDQRQKSKYFAQTLSKCTKKGMDGVDLTDKKATAYHLDAKSTIRFYLRIMFDLMDVAYANSYIVYNMMHSNDLTLIHCKTVVSTYLIGRYTHGSRASPDGKTGSKRKYQYQFERGNQPPHLSELQNIRRRCEYCYKEKIDLKTYVKCTKCGIFLCLIKERNCFKKHHS